VDFRKNKQTIAIVLLISSLFINLVQFNTFRNYKHKQSEAADNEFKLDLDLTCIGINVIKEKKMDELSSMALLSSGTSKASVIYASTSYYKSNPRLQDTIYTLNNNITNMSNIREVIDKNDLTILVPAIKKVIDNPLDETATKELDYLVRKYTVIGSPLP